MNDDDLDARLRALPADISPERNLLPGIEARLATESAPAGPRAWAPRARIARRTIAAASIFAVGLVTGRLTSTSGTAAPTAGDAASAATGFNAATEVQRTGTEYVAALARLSRTVDDESVRAQARESATASLANAVRELASLSDASRRVNRF